MDLGKLLVDAVKNTKGEIGTEDGQPIWKIDGKEFGLPVYYGAVLSNLLENLDNVAWNSKSKKPNEKVSGILNSLKEYQQKIHINQDKQFNAMMEDSNDGANPSGINSETIDLIVALVNTL
jgi:hypothetical protein